MPVTPDLVGHRLPPFEVELIARDSALYALGVGAGLHEGELRHVLDPDVRALPTMPAAVPFARLMETYAALGIDPDAVLHGEERLRLHRPVPAAGRWRSETSVTAVADRGSGATVDLTVEVACDGAPVATVVHTQFVRGAGGFGGPKGPSLARARPAGAPELVVEEATSPQQALLYRLSGDVNPLHVDPAAARAAGFDRPILHGLCTYGFAVRALLHALGADPDDVRGADARFTGVVWPGERLRVELWPADAAGEHHAVVSVPERGATVVDPLLLRLAPR